MKLRMLSIRLPQYSPHLISICTVHRKPLKYSTQKKKIMFNLAQPHGDKLAALLDNEKLPPTDKQRVNQAIEYYKKWLKTLKNIRGNDLKVVPEMVSHLTSYKRYIDVELIFDSDDDFLYRQKGQLKLDNSIIEEFIPILVTTVFADSLKDKELSFGPTQCFSSLRF
jgi:hypothetical protein